MHETHTACLEASKPLHRQSSRRRQVMGGGCKVSGKEGHETRAEPRPLHSQQGPTAEQPSVPVHVVDSGGRIMSFKPLKPSRPT